MLEATDHPAGVVSLFFADRDTGTMWVCTRRLALSLSGGAALHCQDVSTQAKAVSLEFQEV